MYPKDPNKKLATRRSDSRVLVPYVYTGLIIYGLIATYG